MHILMKAASCDFAALGNAIPIRYGPQAIANLAKAFEKPLLCANLFEKNGELVNGLAPYTIADVRGFKLGVIGITDPMRSYGTIFGIDPKAPEEVLPDLIEQVHGEGARTVIILSHFGSKNDFRLAKNISGMDVIISAHDHQQISPPLEVNDTIIVEAGQFGEWLGRLDIVIDEATGKVIESQGELIPITDEIDADRDFLKTVSFQEKKVDKLMSVEIGEILQPLKCFADGECASGNLLADALLDYVDGAQVAFVINGHWTNGLSTGKITQSDLYTANRSAGNPGKLTLKGKQIQQFLIAALKPENIVRKLHPLRGKECGWPHVAGMIVLVESAHPDHVEIQVDGRTIQAEEELVVAASDMEFSEILGYLPIPDEEIEYEVPTILPEIVEAYLKKHSPIMPDVVNRIRFI
ncbi:MAG: hypothetical protein C0410_00390 [Anaerolinea sp.]|nr:hypothetical protein [Anaerolinea sp.]